MEAPATAGRPGAAAVIVAVVLWQGLGGGPWAGLHPDALSLASLGYPALPGSILHWTWRVAAPTWPAGPCVFPPGALPLPAGTRVDGMLLALGPFGARTSNVFRLTF